VVTAFSVSVSSLQVAEHSQHEIATAGFEGLHLAANKLSSAAMADPFCCATEPTCSAALGLWLFKGWCTKNECDKVSCLSGVKQQLSTGTMML